MHPIYPEYVLCQPNKLFDLFFLYICIKYLALEAPHLYLYVKHRFSVHHYIIDVNIL